MRHSWNKNNTCKHCGVYRTKRSWKQLMAITGSKNHYVYGRSWWYGMPNADCKTVVRSIGFMRPDCKR